jgi:hypothetical protein
MGFSCTYGAYLYYIFYIILIRSGPLIHHLICHTLMYHWMEIKHMDHRPLRLVVSCYSGPKIFICFRLFHLKFVCPSPVSPPPPHRPPCASATSSMSSTSHPQSHPILRYSPTSRLIHIFLSPDPILTFSVARPHPHLTLCPVSRHRVPPRYLFLFSAASAVAMPMAHYCGVTCTR